MYLHPWIFLCPPGGREQQFSSASQRERACWLCDICTVQWVIRFSWFSTRKICSEVRQCLGHHQKMKRKGVQLVFAGFVPFFLPVSNNVLQLVLLEPNRSAILEEDPASKCWLKLICFQVVNFQRNCRLLRMGDSVEQYRSAIGKFNPSQCKRVSARIRRMSGLSEILSILAVAQIKRESKQVVHNYWVWYFHHFPQNHGYARKQDQTPSP